MLPRTASGDQPCSRAIFHRRNATEAMGTLSPINENDLAQDAALKGRAEGGKIRGSEGARAEENPKGAPLCSAG
jgi:hypothetical protein